MLKRIMIIASLGAVLGFSVTGYAQEQNPDILKAVNALKQKLGTGWIIEWNEQGTGLKRIEKDLDVVIKRKGKIAPLTSPDEMLGTPEDIAMTFLRNNASLFQLPADLGDLHVGRSGYIVDIDQTFNGLPVFDRITNSLGVHIRVDLKKGIEFVYSNYLPNINISTTPLLSEDDIIAIAQEDTLKNHMTTYDKSEGRLPIPIEKQKKLFTERPQFKLAVYITEKEEPILVYSFDLKPLPCCVRVRYLIDANNGTILRAGDPTMYGFDGSGSGNIFWPNPVNTLNNTTLTDEADSKFAIPLAAYTTKPLKNMLVLSDNRYLLSGPYVRPDDRLEPPKFFAIETGISSIGTLISTKPDFFFDRETNQFEPVMVYQVIDTNQRYIQSLGFDTTTNNSINKRPVKVDPHGWDGQDYSGYKPDGAGTGYISFGEGGIDDAEDADIILHEYGHAIQDNQAPNKYPQALSCNTQAEAMAEGFGDYWQASNTRAISKAHGFDPACFAEWDNADKGSMCRRRVDGTKRYADIVGDCHADGEIWSSALWEILTKLGATEAKRKIADQLILQSHFEMAKMATTNPTFSDGGLALLKADKTLITSGVFTAGHKKIICTALKTNRDIPVLGCL